MEEDLRRFDSVRRRRSARGGPVGAKGDGPLPAPGEELLVKATTGAEKERASAATGKGDDRRGKEGAAREVVDGTDHTHCPSQSRGSQTTRFSSPHCDEQQAERTLSFPKHELARTQYSSPAASHLLVHSGESDVKPAVQQLTSQNPGGGGGGSGGELGGELGGGGEPGGGEP